MFVRLVVLALRRATVYKRALTYGNMETRKSNYARNYKLLLSAISLYGGARQASTYKLRVNLRARGILTEPSLVQRWDDTKYVAIISHHPSRRLPN